MRVLFILQDSVMIERMGVMCLSAALKQAGHETKLVLAGRVGQERLEQVMAEYKPRMVTYSAMTGEYPRLRELNQRLKESRQQVQVYQELVGQQKLYQQEVSAAEESYRNLGERIESIRTAGQERAAATRELQRLREDSPAQAKLIAQHQDEARVAEQKVKEIRGRRTGKRARHLRREAHTAVCRCAQY